MIIGIDLGTTNSLVAYWDEESGPILIPNARGDHLTPSVVGFGDQHELLVGQSACNRLISHPDLTTGAFKRYMGTQKEIPLGNKKYRSEELSAMVLKVLKADAEAYLGRHITEAVVTVPAYFNDTQRKATRIAGELAGLKIERLLNEPTAAALAYGLHRREVESQFLVFDLGGGTFDVSILELFDGIMEVHASAGDNFLGGEDFVDLIVGAFAEKDGRTSDFQIDQLSESQRQSLRNAAERAKVELSESNFAEMVFEWNSNEFRWKLTREELERLSEPLLERLRLPVERAVRDAGIRSADLDEIILVGGATRMPLIQSLAARMFGRLPARHIDPDRAIALGAAVQAGLKSRNAALKDVVITDVCPYTMGIETTRELGSGQFMPGIFAPIIDRNTVVPTSRVESFSTLQDGQRKVNINVYQGENHQVSENIFLGKLTIRVPRNRAGRELFDVRFTYDINGLLEVEVTVLSTGAVKSLIIEENPGILSRKEIEKRFKSLAALKVHPAHQHENRVLVARAERCYQELIGTARLEVGEKLEHFKFILDQQDADQIRKAQSRFKEFLDLVEESL